MILITKTMICHCWQNVTAASLVSVKQTKQESKKPRAVTAAFVGYSSETAAS